MIKSDRNPIGVFDSGYGGLTVLKEITKALPENDYIYVGDNARTPYGTRSFEAVYRFTLEGVKTLFDLGCHLIIIACNTASAKALRSIQQNDLPEFAPNKRVLGVIRPTTEIIGNFTQTSHVGILGTSGTINSKSYPIEIEKFFPGVKVFQQACPLWVPLVENNEHTGDGADFFVNKYLNELFKQSKQIDTLVLGCTHYPLLADKIKEFLPSEIRIISQDEIVAKSLKNYLQRHPEIDEKCSKNAQRNFYTTDSPEIFNKQGTLFFGQKIASEKIVLSPENP